jgi:hypothetical protein
MLIKLNSLKRPSTNTVNLFSLSVRQASINVTLIPIVLVVKIIMGRSVYIAFVVMFYVSRCLFCAHV